LVKLNNLRIFWGNTTQSIVMKCISLSIVGGHPMMEYYQLCQLLLDPKSVNLFWKFHLDWISRNYKYRFMTQNGRDSFVNIIISKDILKQWKVGTILLKSMNSLNKTTSSHYLTLNSIILKFKVILSKWRVKTYSIKSLNWIPIPHYWIWLISTIFN